MDDLNSLCNKIQNDQKTGASSSGVTLLEEALELLTQVREEAAQDCKRYARRNLCLNATCGLVSLAGTVYTFYESLNPGMETSKYISFIAGTYLITTALFVRNAILDYFDMKDLS